MELHVAQILSDFSRLDDTVRLLIIGAIGFLGIVWVGIVIWTAKDVSARTTNSFARIVAVLVVAAFHLLGLFFYVVARPTSTVSEREELALEQELLKQVSESADEVPPPSCPTCGELVRVSFRYCPACKEELRRPCKACKTLLDAEWAYCPDCGREREKGAKA